MLFLAFFFSKATRILYPQWQHSLGHILSFLPRPPTASSFLLLFTPFPFHTIRTLFPLRRTMPTGLRLLFLSPHYKLDEDNFIPHKLYVLFAIAFSYILLLILTDFSSFFPIPSVFPYLLSLFPTVLSYFLSLSHCFYLLLSAAVFLYSPSFLLPSLLYICLCVYQPKLSTFHVVCKSLYLSVYLCAYQFTCLSCLYVYLTLCVPVFILSISRSFHLHSPLTFLPSLPPRLEEGKGRAGEVRRPLEVMAVIQVLVRNWISRVLWSWSCRLNAPLDYVVDAA